MLSPQQQQAEIFRRVVVAAAALCGHYTKNEIAAAAGVSLGTITGWWDGALPKAETASGIARATGMDQVAITRWVHYNGPIPALLPLAELEARARALSAAQSPPAPPTTRASEEPPTPPSKAESTGGR